MSDLWHAANLIRHGQLVAFPTETVYGLGANALDPLAVASIFAVKGRPKTSPLIVHVHSIAMAKSLVDTWPPAATTLADRFWPGPLTLVLRKNSLVPDLVTAGLDTIGIRCPAHPVALELIRAADLPIAAPSANRFTELSPTTAEHVRQSLGHCLSMVLDGGPSAVGIESTVLSLTGERPVILRLGGVSRAAIEALIGPVDVSTTAATEAHPAPGMHDRHYAPRTPLRLVPAGSQPPGELAAFVPCTGAPEEYASRLYATLHALDAQGFAEIAVEQPPDTPEWAAVLDRLRRAAT